MIRRDVAILFEPANSQDLNANDSMERERISLINRSTVFSIEGRKLKLNTAEDARDYVEQILASVQLNTVILSGNTIGVGAAQALADALKQKNNTLKVVNASDIFTGRLIEEIPQAVSALCTALLHSDTLAELNFSDNAFGPAGAEPMVELLSENHHLQRLRLNNNGLGVRGGTLVGEALHACAKRNQAAGRESRLRTFVAGRNRLENGSCGPLGEAFAAHATLVELRMPQNGIRPEGIASLARSLQACPALEVLDLQDNTFTTSGALAFADALASWPRLRHLNVGDCMLEAKGGLAVAEALAIGRNPHLEMLNLQFDELDRKAISALARAITTHLKGLTQLELNGNCVRDTDASILAVKDALAQCGHEDALGALDEMEVESEEDEDNDSDDETGEDKVSKEDDGEVRRLSDKLAQISISGAT